MKKNYFIMFIIVSFLFGCSDSVVSLENHFDSSVDGENVFVSKDHQFTLELESNFDGGYQWSYSISDTTVVRIDSTSSRSLNKDPNIDGGLAIETFYFFAVKDGKCSINLYEQRPWLKDSTPLNTVEFGVTVK